MCRLPMTGEIGIIGASDRKVTAADTQFEPPVPKVWSLTPGPKQIPFFVAMIAGDATAPPEVCGRVIGQAPKSIDDAIACYGAAISRLNRARVQQTVLGPLGLTHETFISKRPGMSRQLVDEIYDAIRQENAGIDSIVCGVDRSGAHLYFVDDRGRAYNQSGLGFCAVGEGADHALSHFMFANYTSDWPMARALLLAFIAKRHAEAAGSVGEATSMFLMSTAGVGPIDGTFLDEFDKSHKTILAAQRRAADKCYKGFEDRVNKLINDLPPRLVKTADPTDSESNSAE